MYYFIYKTTNLKTGKYYIGSHQTNKLDDGYIGCGISNKLSAKSVSERINSPFAKAVHKYGYDSFKREIICFCPNREYALMIESKYVDSNFIKKPMVYNARIGGLHPPETCKNFILESPDKKIYKIKNLTKFCNNNNLFVRSMYNSIYEKRSVKGWKCKYDDGNLFFEGYKNHNEPKKPPMKGVTGCKSIRMTSLLDNTCFCFNSIHEASKKLNIDASNLHKALKNNKKIKNWIPMACRDLW